MRISIDIDGILSNFCGAAGRLANELWPGKIPDGYDPPDWYWTDKLTSKDWDALWGKIRSTVNFWETAEPYVDNIEDLRQYLRTPGRNAFFITSRAITDGNPIQLQTANWFARNCVNINREGNYLPVVPVLDSKLKKQVMEALKIEASIDDLGPTVEACNQIPGHTAYVLDRAWNRDKDYGPRVYSLGEFFEKTA